MRNASFLVLTFGIAVGAYCSAAAADDERIKPGEETLKLSVGAFLPAFSTDIRVNVGGAGGNGGNLEDDLGLTDSTTTGYGGLTWRIAPRHRVNVAYFSTSRDASVTAQTDIDIGDGEIIQAGASVFTEFKFRTVPISYQYSFFKRPNHEMAVSVGAHWGKVDFSVDATAWVADARAQGRVTAESDLPMPLIGLTYDYWFNDRWSLNTRAEYFALDLSSGLNDFDGSIYNARLGTEYWLWNNFGVGAAVNAFGINIDLKKSSWNGSLDYSYWGPQIYVTARF